MKRYKYILVVGRQVNQGNPYFVTIPKLMNGFVLKRNRLKNNAFCPMDLTSMNSENYGFWLSI